MLTCLQALAPAKRRAAERVPSLLYACLVI